MPLEELIVAAHLTGYGQTFGGSLKLHPMWILDMVFSKGCNIAIISAAKRHEVVPSFGDEEDNYMERKNIGM